MSDAALRLRRAKPPDAAAIRDLVRAAYAKWVPIIGREPLPMKADYERAVREHEIDLLFEDRELVGLIEVVARPDHLFIENVAVAPVRQGQGLGRQLLALAEAKARKAGLAELRLLTSAAWEANIRLYRSIGYLVDREEPHLIEGLAGTTVYMKKTLSPKRA